MKEIHRKTNLTAFENHSILDLLLYLVDFADGRTVSCFNVPNVGTYGNHNVNVCKRK